MQSFNQLLNTFPAGRTLGANFKLATVRSIFQVVEWIPGVRSTNVDDPDKAVIPMTSGFLGRKGVKLTKVYNKGRLKILNKNVPVVNSPLASH